LRREAGVLDDDTDSAKKAGVYRKMLDVMFESDSGQSGLDFQPDILKACYYLESKNLPVDPQCPKA
jgi:hypothetical protein